MDNTIQAANSAFHEAFSKACAGSDITGDVSGTLLEFLETAGLPPYYKMKAHLVLSCADEENEPHENLAACRYHLNAAKSALAESKRVYKAAADVEALQRFEGMIDDEFKQFQQRVREAEDID